MRFELSDDQQAIQRTAREFLADRYPPEEVRRLAFEEERGFTDVQWAAIAELGWPALVVPEEDGGLGLGVVELAVVQEELGYALAPMPLLSTVAGGLLIAAGGDPEQRAEHLPALADGALRATAGALTAGGAPLEVRGTSATGTLVAVPDAGSADLLAAAGGADGGPMLVDLRAGGERVRVQPAEALDPTRRLATVDLRGAEAQPLAGGDAARARDVIAVAVAAESVGVAQRAMEMAVAYAKERKQFGRPIGAYQAVSHVCAQMLLEVEGARSTVLYAAWALDHAPDEAPLAAAMAKAYASDAGRRVPAAALQVHGGIGFTWEHDLHLWLKRGRANAALWGDARAQRARVADLLGL
jgi:alkylation response protein AidB-like acyl-CoA dehydrogenase